MPIRKLKSLFFSSWQEEALREENLALEKIGAILATMTTKKAAMVSLLILHLLSCMTFNKRFIHRKIFNVRCQKRQETSRILVQQKISSCCKKYQVSSRFQLVQSKNWMDTLMRWSKISWKTHSRTQQAEWLWKIACKSGKISVFFMALKEHKVA